MSRYIDADKLMSNAVIPLVKSASLRNRNLYSAVKRVANEIELAPTEDVAPVIHAKWIEDAYQDEPYVCSNCGWAENDDMHRIIGGYCVCCGAKMDEEKRNNE